MTFQVDVQICGITFACLVLVLFTVGITKQQTPLAVPIQAQYNGFFFQMFWGWTHLFVYLYLSLGFYSKSIFVFPHKAFSSHYIIVVPPLPIHYLPCAGNTFLSFVDTV